MRDLSLEAFRKLAVTTILMGLALFACAGTFAYWQAWLFLDVFFIASLAIFAYLARHDPALMERRLRGGPMAEKTPAQKRIVLAVALQFAAILIVAGLDRRLGWSAVPLPVAIGGDLLFALGALGIFFVFRENSFASATVELSPGQKVISSGPYALLRHPMYFFGLIYVFGIALALGSWPGVAIAALVIPTLIWRLLDEEKFLAKNLAGYADYRAKVKYRLLPFVW